MGSSGWLGCTVGVSPPAGVAIIEGLGGRAAGPGAMIKRSSACMTWEDRCKSTSTGRPTAGRRGVSRDRLGDRRLEVL